MIKKFSILLLLGIIFFACKPEIIPPTPGPEDPTDPEIPTDPSGIDSTALISSIPSEIIDNSSDITIVLNTKGTAMASYTGDIYAHTGVITSESSGSGDWKYVPFDWGVNNDKCKLTKIEDNFYHLKITGGIRAFYNVPADEMILELAFVFRSADGSQQIKDNDNDIFLPVSSDMLNVRFTSPTTDPYILENQEVTLTASANGSETLSIFLNNTDSEPLATTTQSQLSSKYSANKGESLTFIAVASKGEQFVTDTLVCISLDDPKTEARPSGLADGITVKDNEVTFILYAPGKKSVVLLGDFNNFTPSNEYILNKDEDYFWITLKDLEQNREYICQYLIDGKIRVADPYAKKISDPWNDHYISPTIYPNLIEYPEGKTTEIAMVVNTSPNNYNWNITDFKAAKKEDLVIYELFFRDFTTERSVKAAKEKLPYLAALGVNAIELMPFNEFEGNDSWGYNPSFYFATDKAYGTEEDYKEFIDACHANGMAVIMDMVLNHSYGQSPMVRMYMNDDYTPTPDNPWYNQESNFATPDAQWGADFNHESEATRAFVKRVCEYWIKEFKIDGYRFDFTKGFSNTPYPNGDWGSAYDAQRISNLKRIYDEIITVDDDAIVIFEHLAHNSEERELANHGIMLWGNMNHNANEATMGYNESNKSNLDWAFYGSRSWSQPNLVAYVESHDEERLMFKNLQYGASNGSYSAKELETALQRMEAMNVLFMSIPGPKMIWQFGELGYDYELNDDRLAPKPVRWDYYDMPARRELYDVFSKMNKLKVDVPAFETNNYVKDVSGAVKQILLKYASGDVCAVANFDLTDKDIVLNVGKAATWVEQFTGDTIVTNSDKLNLTLAPGEYRLLIEE